MIYVALPKSAVNTELKRMWTSHVSDYRTFDYNHLNIILHSIMSNMYFV